MAEAAAAVLARFSEQVLGLPLPVGIRLWAAEEVVRRRGPAHSLLPDEAAISHHYDVGNDFYTLVLGPSLHRMRMTGSPRSKPRFAVTRTSGWRNGNSHH